MPSPTRDPPLLEPEDMTIHTVVEDRRRELGRFLRSRRVNLRPADMGFDEDPSRRATGLRREEVARRAHVSVSWYVHLEQGRRMPSPAVLDNLSTALGLNRAESLYLHSLVGASAPMRTEHTAPDPESVAIARALVELHDGAAPVDALDGRGEVVAANEAMSVWYAHQQDWLGTNFVWWLYTNEAARETIADWREVVREYTAGIRFYMAATRVDAEAVALLHQLDRVSPEFRVDWLSYDVADPRVRRRTLVHPSRGPVDFDVVTVQPTIRPSIVVVFHVEHPARTPGFSSG